MFVFQVLSSFSLFQFLSPPDSGLGLVNGNAYLAMLNNLTAAAAASVPLPLPVSGSSPPPGPSPSSSSVADQLKMMDAMKMNGISTNGVVIASNNLSPPHLQQIQSVQEHTPSPSAASSSSPSPALQVPTTPPQSAGLGRGSPSSAAMAAAAVARVSPLPPLSLVVGGHMSTELATPTVATPTTPYAGQQGQYIMVN